jgi:hypothetical protein
MSDASLIDSKTCSWVPRDSGGKNDCGGVSQQPAVIYPTDQRFSSSDYLASNFVFNRVIFVHAELATYIL